MGTVLENPSAVRKPYCQVYREPVIGMESAQTVAVRTSMLILVLIPSFSFRLLSLDCNIRLRNLGRKAQKKKTICFWTIDVLQSLRVMLCVSLICIYLQSWGSSVDALNNTYPSPLPDHRVLLASTPTGCMTMIYFRT